jgi:hypothetical protein
VAVLTVKRARAQAAGVGLRAGFLRALCVLALLPVWVQAESVVEENAAKAALVFNFARYTEWPARPPHAPQTPLQLCIFGDLGVTEACAELEGRSVAQRSVQVTAIGYQTPVEGCDVLFIDSRERRIIEPLIAAVRDRPVLTVGEIPDFSDYGGIINLYRSEGRFRFEVSLRAARRAGLTLSSRMLRLARILD